MSGDLRALRRLFPDVARSKPSVLAPVGVPVRSVRAPGAAVFPTAHWLEPIGDFCMLGRSVLLEPGAVAMEEQAAHEDHQTPQVVLVEAPDGSDEISFDRHEEAFLGS